jgi:hypothetical protein
MGLHIAALDVTDEKLDLANQVPGRSSSKARFGISSARIAAETRQPLRSGSLRDACRA